MLERTVTREGKLVSLLPMEFKLLEYFMRRPGQTVTCAMLLEDVWNVQSPTYSNIVDVQIGNLRRKLDPTDNRRFIVSVRSVGFKLNADHRGLSTTALADCLGLEQGPSLQPSGYWSRGSNLGNVGRPTTLGSPRRHEALKDGRLSTPYGSSR